MKNGVDVAVKHGLFWLMVANAVGLWMALLLWMPQLGLLTGELGYGRWVPVHLNLQLYGWTSLPLVAWLFHSFRITSIPLNKSREYVIWLWSAALLCGAVHWLRGVRG